MLSFITPKDRNTTLQHLAAFYIIVSVLLVAVTMIGINVEMFVALLPFAFVENMHYRALWHGYKFYDIPVMVALLVLSSVYAYLMMSYEVTSGSYLYVIYAFVIAGVLFGHMRFVLIRLKQIKDTKK
ncbi:MULTISPECIES: hypothetical protein [Vibrio]|uniref:hypothetical protein n=1 Tax=Vibrio TaxID=662 RepID=UPI00078EDBE0|nr:MULTISPECIES: hypothetical protein [Vibrio]BAU70873.1 hypothetical protein [Vibrio sp. 04Ya108]BBM67558.1 hypothetical protein VA249_42040 [Vibrio alfacsensis]BCN27040.1 hypothetical protein VYA_42320 [Vibrio alfacsensis]